MCKWMREMTWPEVEALDKASTLVMLPVGSFEQHGYHLPLCTDTILADQLAKLIFNKLSGDFPLLILPTLAYGQSVEHMDFPGTVSLNPETLLAVIRDITESLAVQGFRKIVLLNGHGGNSGIINAYAAQLRRTHHTHIFIMDISAMISVPEKPVDILTPVEEDFHGGELETSLILSAHPELVHMERAEDARPVKYKNNNQLTLGGPFFMGWSAADVSSVGISGGATKAGKEKGQAMFEHMAVNACEALKEILKWDGAPLYPPVN